jgi:hypothetical protein
MLIDHSINPYLDKYNIYDKPNCTAQNGICSKLGRVAHAVMPAITSKDHLLSIERIQNLLWYPL